MTDITEINKKIKDQLNWIEEDYNVDLWRDCFEITIIALEHTIEALDDLLDDEVDEITGYDDVEVILMKKAKYQKQLEQLKTK